jgi:toxin ParE1/3/4
VAHKVAFGPESESDLDAIYEYIVEKGFPNNALRFTESIVRFCMTLGAAPNRGTQRFNVLPGLRTIGFHHTVEIVFQVRDKEKEVRIVRVLHGGQDVERALSELH